VAAGAAAVVAAPVPAPAVNVAALAPAPTPPPLVFVGAASTIPTVFALTGEDVGVPIDKSNSAAMSVLSPRICPALGPTSP
jgi:hypothetical protein